MSEETKKYTSAYDIKDYYLNQLGPKYFPEDVIEGYNVGMLGYALDMAANTTEDVFNTVPVVINEMYPNLAVMPSSIYNYASLFQESNLMAAAPTMECVLLMPMDAIEEYAEASVDGTYKTFTLDQRTAVVIENHKFILDYDVLFTIKPYRDDHIITAIYVRDFNNSMNSVKNPYLKLQKVNYKGVKYIAVLVKMRRCNKYSMSKRVIDNDKINSTIVEVSYSDQLANFEVFYRESTDKPYIQLQKRILNSRAIKDPFCYFRIKDENVLEISFTVRENYFKPKFNSEIVVETWETTGSEGNFDMYQGYNVEVYRNSDKYENNARVPVIAIPQTGASGGKDRLSLLDLRDKVADCFATVDSYTTEADLQRHFNSFNLESDTRVTFIKKRDDIFDRLFTSFSIGKDELGSYYKTNTLKLKIYKDQFDHQFEQSQRLLLKPCNTFIYNGNSTKEMIKVDEDQDIDIGFNTQYIYNNPFLMTLSDNGVVGYYLSNINDKLPLDYEYVNNDSLIQFICNNLYVYRSAISNENTYKFKLYLTATDNDIENPLVDEFGNETGKVKVALSFLHKNGNEVGYIECYKTAFDKERLSYTFEGVITTDDYISITEAIRIYDLKNMIDGKPLVSMIPMTNLKINVYTFFEYKENNSSHSFNRLPGFENCTLTNKYTTEESRAELVTPLNMLRSNMTWDKDDDGKTFVTIHDVPVIKQVEIVTEKEQARFDRFIETLNAQYDYMKNILSQKTNNYSVDMKFYNTYGRSNNFVLDATAEKPEVINRVNCTLDLQVYASLRSEAAMLVNNMKMFIKEYFESINKDVNDGIFISNLIQQLENTFPQIRYVKFISLNGYDTFVQSIENMTLNIDDLEKQERIEFIPEYLNIELDDIYIEILNR